MNNNREDLELIAKITALTKVNRDIISSIEESTNDPLKVVQSLKYRIVESSNNNSNTAKFTIQELISASSPKAIVNAWKPKSNSTPLLTTQEMNLFNDNINYTINSFEDLKRFNSEVPLVAAKFGSLNPSNSPVLRNFQFNLELIQVHLGDIQESLIGVQSRLSNLQDVLQDLNMAYSKVINEINATNSLYHQDTFTLNTESILKAISSDPCSISPKTLTKSASSHLAVSCNESFSSGVHRWSISYKPTGMGWLLIAVQSTAKASGFDSYGESTTFGVNVTSIGPNNGTYIGGVRTFIGTLIAFDSGRIDAELDCDERKFKVSHDSWEHTIDLPSNGPWWPHFNSYDANFSLV